MQKHETLPETDADEYFFIKLEDITYKVRCRLFIHINKHNKMITFWEAACVSPPTLKGHATNQVGVSLDSAARATFELLKAYQDKHIAKHSE